MPGPEGAFTGKSPIDNRVWMCYPYKGLLWVKPTFSGKRHELMIKKDTGSPAGLCTKRRDEMKRRKWIYPVLILLCLAAFYGYQTMDRLRTDTAAPEIRVSTEAVQVSVQDPQPALLQGVTAADAVDGDVTDSLVVEGIRLLDPDGTVSVTYAAFDSAGNVSKVQRELRYTDYTSPRFSLDKPLVFVQNSGFDVLNEIRAWDALDGDISHRIRATSLDDVSVAVQGTHDVQFRVTNSLGETVELVLPVEVNPAGSYQAELSLSDYLVYLEAGDDFEPESYLDRFTWNRETTSLKNGLPGHYSLRTTGEVDTWTPGVYSVAYQVTYTAANPSNPENSLRYTGYSKLIVVVEG